MFQKYILLVFIALSVLLVTQITHAKVDPPPRNEFVTNPAYSDRKVPADEKKMNLKGSKKRVRKEFSQLQSQVNNLCQGNNSVFRINKDQSSLKVTTFKNWDVPVAARFLNYDGYVYWNNDEKRPKATMIIDTTSWESGAPDRDSRVKYFLLKANKKKYAVAQMNLEMENFASKTASGSINIREREYGVEANLIRYQKSGNWYIRSAEPFRLFGKIPAKDMTKIMKLCNHKSLTPVVDLEWRLMLVPACKTKH